MLSDSNAWYTYNGTDSDTVISSRVRIARNILNNRFPPVMDAAEAEAVYQMIIHTNAVTMNSSKFHTIQIGTLDALARKIFEERGLIPSDLGQAPVKGFIIRNDGVVSATINIKDHIRVAAFHAGFDIPGCFALAKEKIDLFAQELDFCAVPEFGYLSSDIGAIGSGIKSSVLCSLPALTLTEHIQETIKSLSYDNFNIHAYYAQNGKLQLGYLYLISSKSAAGTTDADQLAHIVNAIDTLAAKEREMRTVLLKEKIWHTQDLIVKAFSLAKNALFLDLKDTIDVIFKIKLGINLGFIEGVTHEICITLLYQTQTAHIAFLLLNGNIEFDEAFPSDELRIDRIRALLVQDALKSAEMHVKKTLRLQL